MEKKDYYELKDLVLGLRDEYQKNEQLLLALKQYTTICDKRVSDLYFDVHQSFLEDRLPTLGYHLIIKRNKLHQLYVDYAKKKGFYLYGRDYGMVRKDSQSGYQIGKDYHVRVDDEKAFAELSQTILESAFALNIQTHYLELENEQIDCALEIHHGGILLNIRKDQGDLFDSLIVYNSREDKIYFDIYSKNAKLCDCSSQYLEKALKIEFPKDMFSDYHRDVIDHNEDTDKKLIICGTPVFEPKQIYSFDEETPKTIVLRNNHK